MTATVTPYAAAADLDRRLGALGPAAEALRRRDATGAVTDLSVAARHALGSSFVPPADGGTMTTLDETLALARVAARRDATVMPATMFGITATTAVLIGGDATQRAEVVDLAAAGRTVAFAVSEPEDGDDPLAGTTALLDDGRGGHLLRGRKWRVGMGPDTTAAVVLARTGGRGPAAFSLVVVRGAALDAARVRDRATDGWRGVGFADLHFDDAPVPAADVVGGRAGRGRGVELMLRAMQLVRVTSTAAGLGAADLALRLAAPHRAADPVARADLGTAAAAAAAAAVHALVSARALHTAPGEQSLGSSTVKWVVTELTTEVFDRCADVLGFSALFAGPFAIARRDAAVARYVDTDPHANLQLVGAALRRLALRPSRPDRARDGATDLDAALPPLDPGATALAARGDALFDGLPGLVADLHRAGDDPELLDRAERVADDVDALFGAFAAPGLPTPELVELAARGAFLHAAAACVHVAAANRHRDLFGLPPGDRAWVSAAVDLLRDRAAGGRRRPGTDHTDALAAALHDCLRRGVLFGVVPIPTTDDPTDPSETKVPR